MPSHMRNTDADERYARAIASAHREALYTLAVAGVLALFFWGALWALKDEGLGWWGMPWWFWGSCIGGYLLSCLLVLWLVKRVMQAVDFEALESSDDEPLEGRSDSIPDEVAR